MVRSYGVLALFVVLMMGGSGLAQAPAIAPAPATATAAFAGWENESPDPVEPGYHKMVFRWEEKGESRQMPFMVYLPEGYQGRAETGQKWPVLVYLSGMGERGADPAIVMNCGIPVDMASRPEVRKWLPMIMILPLCPAEVTFDDPDYAAEVVRLTRAVSEYFPVDKNRLYVTGLSMGGRGCWAVARQAPDLFAVVAPIVSRELQAEDTAKKVAGGGTTFLVISGLADEKSEPDSKKMVDALRERNVDVVYAPVPRAGHYLWPQYYSNRQFYEWLLMHERGKKAPATRPSADHLVGLYFQRSDTMQAFQDKLQAEFGKFAQYWYIDNCARRGVVGLKPEIGGRKNVFVTYPLLPEVACRLQTTLTVPSKKTTRLYLTCGRHPQGEWELVVRVNEQEGLRIKVDATTAKDGWLSTSYDLTRWANAEARIQLVHQATTWGHSEAYWAEIKIVSE